MKMFSEMSLKSIRNKLAKVGVTMSDERFSALTYSELKKVYRKASKAYKLYEQVDAIINKAQAPTPQMPLTNDSPKSVSTKK